LKRGAKNNCGARLLWLSDIMFLWSKQINSNKSSFEPKGTKIFSICRWKHDVTLEIELEPQVESVTQPLMNKSLELIIISLFIMIIIIMEVKFMIMSSMTSNTNNDNDYNNSLDNNINIYDTTGTNIKAYYSVVVSTSLMIVIMTIVILTKKTLLIIKYICLKQN